MRRRSSMTALLLAALGPAGLFAAPAGAQENAPDPTVVQDLKFLQGLRDRGYHDLALDFINSLRDDPETSPGLKALLDYEEGRGLLDESSRTGDLEKRRELLEAARVKLNAFAKANPNHPLAAEAGVQAARLLFERAQTAVLMANEIRGDAERKAKLAEARASFDESRTAYGAAIEPLRKKFAAYPPFIPDDDPRHAQKDETHVAMMSAELQKALVDYEEAQTYPFGAGERNKLLDEGITAFEETYKRYRTYPAGIFARMWQGKCYEEQGKLNEAMGIYKEIMEHGDKALVPLQRRVQYFQIIVDGKRNEHPLAVDRAADWLKNYPNAHRSDEGLGVKLELAKNILAQLPELKDSDKPIAVNRATDLLTQVVREYSVHKPEALKLLQQYRPKAAATANIVSTLSYDDAYAQAEGAVGAHEWDRAVALLKHAIRNADPLKDTEKANRARYLMAFAFYEGQKFYDADVMAEHLARNYPKWSMAPKAAEIAIEALVRAYNDRGGIDRESDLDRLIDLCNYTAEAFSTTDQADAARMTVGEIAMLRVKPDGKRDLEGAIKAFESVRPESPKKLDAQVRAAEARYTLSQGLRAEGKTDQADEEVKKALETLEATLNARREAKVPQSDPAFLANANLLANIYNATGRAKDAVALLEPIAKGLAAGNQSETVANLHFALLTILLRSHIGNGQSDAAIADMRLLEGVAGGAKESLTQLYFELGRTLKKELDELEAKGASARLQQTRVAYTKFLQALADSKSGQTFESLSFAGESLLALGQAKQADAVFDRVLTTYAKDPNFKKLPNSEGAILRVKLRKAEASRKQHKFAEAQKLCDEVKQLNSRLLEPYLEQGYLYEDWAASDPSKWNAAYNHWRRLAAQLERANPKRVEYYEALLHVATALEGLGRKNEAAQTLKSVLALSRTVGNPEMKARYQAMLARLSR